MPFSSLLFLSVFLPAFLAAYGVSPRALKNATALGFSLVFYAWGAPRLLPVVLALGVIDFYLGRAIARRRSRLVLALGITLHLSVLGYFKYSNFLVAQTNTVLALLPHPLQLAWAEVPLPIGISFLTFEEISYLVDTYRGDARPARSVGRYLLFLMLFPHSIAGPIFRWKDLEAQLDTREHSIALVASGFSRFILGLAKKVIIADAAAVIVDPVFASPGSAGPRFAWLAALAYTIQIYYDFSGYSDMAIGLGRMAGFRFKENFDSPYRSASITEFWRRWHISLSTWMRDYLYVPLGGNRHGERRTRLHVFLVFLLSGLWHGAAWTFVAWGALHGGMVVAERTALVKRVRARLPRPLNVASTLLLVMVGWVFFRAASFRAAGEMLASMAFVHRDVDPVRMLPGAVLPARSALLLAYAVTASMIAPAFLDEPGEARLLARVRPIAVALAPLALLLVIAQLVNTNFTPLIYFKF